MHVRDLPRIRSIFTDLCSIKTRFPSRFRCIMVIEPDQRASMTVTCTDSYTGHNISITCEKNHLWTIMHEKIILKNQNLSGVFAFLDKWLHEGEEQIELFNTAIM